MTKPLSKLVGAVLFLLTAASPQVAGSAANVLVDDHWLAAACPQVPIGGRIVGRVVQTPFGVAVETRPGMKLVLHCNVEPDLFHNLIQVIAEDNSPAVAVKATFFRQNIDSPAAPEEIVSVMTSDQPGLQVAELFFDPPFDNPDELLFMYFIRIEMVRGNTDPVRVYSVSLRDVL
jgi:hypothetical protein